jgi:hypothetical protein
MRSGRRPTILTKGVYAFPLMFSARGGRVLARIRVIVPCNTALVNHSDLGVSEFLPTGK